MTGTPSYDEAEIASCLAGRSLAVRAAFSCACAERLMPSFGWFCALAGTSDFNVVRAALDAAWTPGGAGARAATDDVLAAMPPNDEGELFLGSAVAQNAVAAVGYSLEVRDNGAVQAAVWAARQLYVAADTVVQQGAPAYSYVENIDQEQPVILMVQGIYSTLDSAGSRPLADLRADAQEDGDAFLRFVNGEASR